MSNTKSELVRGFITKICQEKKIPPIKFDRWFLDEPDWKIIDYLNGRKGDLPSIEFLEKTFKFKRFETELTLTDHMELLNKSFVKDAFARMYQELVDEYKKNGDKVSEKEVIAMMKHRLLVTDTAISQTNSISLNDTDALVASYEEWSKLSDPIQTGFDRIDAEAPFRRGELVCLIGGSGSGKSWTALRMFAENIKTKSPALYYSLEMSETELLARVLPILENGNVKHSEFRFSKISSLEYRKLIQKYKGNYEIVTRKAKIPIKIATIEAKLEERRIKGEDTDVVYIDYIGLMDQDRNWNAEESISGQLKRLAQEYNCMILILVQADTATLQSKSMPTLTSARENKGIVYDCDTVFALKAERNNDKDNTVTIDYDFLKRRGDGAFISLTYRVNHNIGKWAETFAGQVQ